MPIRSNFIPVSVKLGPFTCQIYTGSLQKNEECARENLGKMDSWYISYQFFVFSVLKDIRSTFSRDFFRNLISPIFLKIDIFRKSQNFSVGFRKGKQNLWENLWENSRENPRENHGKIFPRFFPIFSQKNFLTNIDHTIFPWFSQRFSHRFSQRFYKNFNWAFRLFWNVWVIFQTFYMMPNKKFM